MSVLNPPPYLFYEGEKLFKTKGRMCCAMHIYARGGKKTVYKDHMKMLSHIPGGILPCFYRSPEQYIGFLEGNIARAKWYAKKEPVNRVPPLRVLASRCVYEHVDLASLPHSVFRVLLNSCGIEVGMPPPKMSMEMPSLVWLVPDERFWLALKDKYIGSLKLTKNPKEMVTWNPKEMESYNAGVLFYKHGNATELLKGFLSLQNVLCFLSSRSMLFHVALVFPHEGVAFSVTRHRALHSVPISYMRKTCEAYDTLFVPIKVTVRQKEEMLVYSRMSLGTPLDPYFGLFPSEGTTYCTKFVMSAMDLTGVISGYRLSQTPEGLFQVLHTVGEGKTLVEVRKRRPLVGKLASNPKVCDVAQLFVDLFFMWLALTATPNLRTCDLYPHMVAMAMILPCWILCFVFRQWALSQ